MRSMPQHQTTPLPFHSRASFQGDAFQPKRFLQRLYHNLAPPRNPRIFFLLLFLCLALLLYTLAKLTGHGQQLLIFGDDGPVRSPDEFPSEFRLGKLPDEVLTLPNETPEETANRLAEMALRPSFEEAGFNADRRSLIYLHRRFRRNLDLNVPFFDPGTLFSSSLLFSSLLLCTSFASLTHSLIN